MTNKQEIILGLNHGGHDTAAALMIDGELISACEEERFSLEKHSTQFPNLAIQECLRSAGIKIEEVSRITNGFDSIHFIREVYLAKAMEDEGRIGFLINDIDYIKYHYNILDTIRKETQFHGEIKQFRHHLCHLASTYYPSGFTDALLVSYDGIGEIETGMLAKGIGGNIEVVHNSTRYPESLGLLYSALTFYLGWRHHCDEGIIMGLAPYGDSSTEIPGSDKTYAEIFKDIIIETGDFDYRINQDWIAYYEKRDTWVSPRFYDTFGPKRAYEDPVTQHHKNIAAALQDRLEEVVLKQLTLARKKFGLSRLCLAGGVALNCSMNGSIETSGIFDEIFVHPASSDQGVALGACYLAHKESNPKLTPTKNHDFYKGSRFSREEILQTLNKKDLPFEEPADLYQETAKQLAAGRIVGWHQRGAEFGPRALGNRSILCKPYPAEMKDHLNAQVKFREPFRPFAPSVLAEKCSEYFLIKQESPHMLIACQVHPDKREKIPAVVHVDGSCRVQTVKAGNNARFRKLLEAFYSATGCPVLLNTSFNVKGQPIVNTPEQAIDCFLNTKIDFLVVGDFTINKENVKK